MQLNMSIRELYLIQNGEVQGRISLENWETSQSVDIYLVYHPTLRKHVLIMLEIDLRPDGKTGKRLFYYRPGLIKTLKELGFEPKIWNTKANHFFIPREYNKFDGVLLE